MKLVKEEKGFFELHKPVCIFKLHLNFHILKKNHKMEKNSIKVGNIFFSALDGNLRITNRDYFNF